MPTHFGQHKRIIAVDFDGVLHGYSRGWENGLIYDEPVPGAVAAIDGLQRQGYEVVVFTARAELPPVVTWLEWWGFPPLEVVNRKPAAGVYLDDRALRFRNWTDALQEIERMSGSGEMGE